MSFLAAFLKFLAAFNNNSEVAKITAVKFSKTCKFLFSCIYSLETAIFWNANFNLNISWTMCECSGEFYGKKFCKNFRSMMGRILQYSRNTGYKCQMNGHSSPFDQSKSGDENSVKMELLEFAERFLQEFWCLGHSVNSLKNFIEKFHWKISLKNFIEKFH